MSVEDLQGMSNNQTTTGRGEDDEAMTSSEGNKFATLSETALSETVKENLRQMVKGALATSLWEMDGDTETDPKTGVTSLKFKRTVV